MIKKLKMLLIKHPPEKITGKKLAELRVVMPGLCHFMLAGLDTDEYPILSLHESEIKIPYCVKFGHLGEWTTDFEHGTQEFRCRIKGCEFSIMIGGV